MIRIISTKPLRVIFLLIAIFFGISLRRVSAQVVINEVSPISTPEWVEIYNTGENNISLNDYSINFGSENQNLLFCNNAEVTANSYKIIELSTNWLANTGDVVILRSGDDEIDKVGYGTGYSLPKPDSASKSLTRSPDGSSNWVLSSQSSRQGDVISFNCPSPTPAPSVIPGQTNFKAVYRINKSRDGNSAELSGVGIYVDGNYIHHEDDEIIEFFNGHECYSGVSCDLGTHTISLRKSGYTSWEDTQNFTAGANFEINPVLKKEESSTPVPTPDKSLTPKPTPTKTPKPTPLKTPLSASASATTATPSANISEVLGTKTQTNDPSVPRKIPSLPLILVFAGVCFIAVPIFSIIKGVKKDYTETNEKQDSGIS